MPKVLTNAGARVAYRGIQRQSKAQPVEGYFATVHLGPGASQGLVLGLRDDLRRIRLGRVTGADRDILTLSLASDSPAALAEVARILARLRAPTGTWVGNAECPRMIEVARLTPLPKAPVEALFRGSVSVGHHGTLALYPQTEARLGAVLERAVARLH
ncbi:MAG: hypothetical protein AAFQ39_09905 [Pseudomonadota bacterium]